MDKNQTEKELMSKVTERLKLTPEFIQARERFKKSRTVAERLEALETERQAILKGDPAAIERQHSAGRLTARERISRLLDAGTFQELDLWHRPYETGFNIGEERSRGDGVVIGYGEVDHRAVSIWVQDATVLGGTVGTVNARKVNMIMCDTLNARVPIIGVFDSLGLRAHDVIQYPEFYSTSTMAYFQTIASGVIPKISLVMGPCSGDLAIIAMMSDFVFLVRSTSWMHLESPPGGVSEQEIGDAWNVHAKVSGCYDVFAENEEDCLEKCRQLLSYLPQNSAEPPPLPVRTNVNPVGRAREKVRDAKLCINLALYVSILEYWMLYPRVIRTVRTPEQVPCAL